MKAGGIIGSIFAALSALLLASPLQAAELFGPASVSIRVGDAPRGFRCSWEQRALSASSTARNSAASVFKAGVQDS